ncbi:hypothetical protein GCM10020229_06460 [Kitasatospora albolonga]|uniref:hypothetical protein n=1 Tax=Kitasatospora albolonga TaxID=68173 RepID=UPI0031E590D3
MSANERGTLGRRSLLAGLTGAGAVGALALGAGTAEAAAGTYVVDVLAKNADPTGQTPSDQAFKDAATELLASFQPDPVSGAIPKKVLLIPPGNYLITQPDALLPGIAGPGNGGIVDGIAIVGHGKRLSRITYAPTVRNTTFWTNRDRYKNIRISGLTFDSRDATSTFNYAYSSDAGGVQDTWYTDVEWRGDWKAGIVLDGAPDRAAGDKTSPQSDLNSEMGWDHCQVAGSYADAFLVMGATPVASQQDQFLNMWFRDCKVEFKSGVFVRNERGGSMNFTGGSYILTDTEAYGTFFKLGGTTGRADSVNRLYVQGIRFELRSDKHKVIDSAWYKGNITFVSCDDTALSFQGWATTAVATHVYRFDAVTPNRAPMIRYQDCALMGSHQVTTTSATTTGKLLYDGCRFSDANAATGGTGATGGLLRWTGTAPWYEFRDCSAGAVRIPDVKGQ